MKAKQNRQAKAALAALIVLIAGVSAPLVMGAQLRRTTPQTRNLDALFKAAVEGDSGRIRALLDQGANVNAKNADGETILMSAVGIQSRYKEDKIDHSEVVKLLLSRGADIDATDKKGRTALMQALAGVASESAVIGPSTPIVRLLIA